MIFQDISNSTIQWRLLELLLIFIGVPILLSTSVFWQYKLIGFLTALIYCLVIMYKKELFTVAILLKISTSFNWKTVAFRFGLIAILTTVIMYFYDYDNLFSVVLKKPKIWIGIVFFYSVFSVYPQELLYRTFFFYRYKILFKNPTLLIIINAFVFSLAHLIFKNGLVLILTLIGGLIFAITYHKSKSLMLTSIEHSIYGSWLFTLGIGEMLAFPTA